MARANPAQFNLVHIALKQKILRHVRLTLRGRKMELVRDAVVAAIDELRLMVSGFYIESREAALRASEEKYRNSIDHAPDPMYEIDPESFAIIAANSAAVNLTRNTAGAENNGPVGRHIGHLTADGLCPGLVAASEIGGRKGLGTRLRPADGGPLFRRQFGVDPVRQQALHPDDSARRHREARDAR